MSNAFAPIVRARPDPICGRPVHQGSPPFDYSPILLLKPFGFRIASDTLSSRMCRGAGFRSVLAVSGFRLRARLDVSIPCSSPGQRGIAPAFGYSAPHPSAEGTLTPMIHALPSAHNGDESDSFGFADPGGNSTLRAASKKNPRNLPCPTCNAPNRLTPADHANGYQCDSCADADMVKL